MSDEAISTFRHRLQTVFLDGERDLARRYLRELVERVEVGKDRIRVVAKPLSAAMMMAAETTNAPNGFTARSEVLTFVPDWLRRTGSNRRHGG